MNAKTQNILAWVFTILIAIMFLLQGVLKFMPAMQTLDQWALWEVEPNMMKIVGVFEIIGAIGIFIPKFRKLAILGLSLIMMAAIYILFTHNDFQNITGPILFLIMLILLFLFRRSPKKEEI